MGISDDDSSSSDDDKNLIEALNFPDVNLREYILPTSTMYIIYHIMITAVIILIQQELVLFFRTYIYLHMNIYIYIYISSFYVKGNLFIYLLVCVYTCMLKYNI